MRALLRARWLGGLALALLSGAAALSLSQSDGAAESGQASAGSELLFRDTGARRSAKRVWGHIDCASAGRATVVRRTASRRPTLAARRGSRRYRRLRVIDGDDYFGERCELGQNDHRKGPTAVYREGDRIITSVMIRLPRTFPLRARRWQGVLQMKQSQPSAAGGGSAVLWVGVYRGRWSLETFDRTLWATRAHGRRWTRLTIDAIYSQDPRRGRVRIFVDRNGDGDTSDRREQSRIFKTATLKREGRGGGADGVPPGASIPSHLRIGVYHDEDIACPRPHGCAVHVDDVSVVAR